MTQPFIQRNIVVIGGTGTGKSSFLNNLALVLRFATFEDAESGAYGFVPPIPVRMRFNNVSITEGQDHNERSDPAGSRTLRPQIYRITYGNVVFNFIDTPGMSDSKGQELDEEHVKHISTCIREFEEVHGILLILKSSDNTLNDSSKYTFNMLLSCFGTAAGKIISFGITHAGYNKNHGGAPNVIQKYLQDLQNNPEIDFSDSNLYCFESSPLFHVLSTKKGSTCKSSDRQVYSWSFQNNVEELHRLLTQVVNRNDSYNASNIQTVIFARHIYPALTSLVPLIERKDQEYKYEVDLLQKKVLTKSTEIYGLRSNLMKVRRWREPYTVERIRYVDETKNVTKERIEKEEYVGEEVDFEATRLLKSPFPYNIIANLLVVTRPGFAFIDASGNVVRRVTKTRDKVQQYVEEVTIRVPETYSVTRYRDREACEEDPEVRRSINRIEDEQTRLENELTEKCRLYERFKDEKEIVLRFISDVILHQKEHAMVCIGHGGHLGASMDVSSWIEELKRKGHWKPSDSSPTPQESMTRLRAIENYEHFGSEIKKIITQYEEFAHVQYRVVDIPVEGNNPFIKMVLEQK